jgi:hypothetical protein
VGNFEVTATVHIVPTCLLAYLLTCLTYLLTYLLNLLNLLAYLLTYSMEHSPFWEANWFSASKLNSPHFIEPECSLPHSQVPATCPYPEPAQSSPYPTFHCLKIQLNIILPSTPGSLKWSLSLPQYSPPKTCICLSSPLYALHARPISFFSIWSPEKYWVRRTDH